MAAFGCQAGKIGVNECGDGSRVQKPTTYFGGRGTPAHNIRWNGCKHPKTRVLHWAPELSLGNRLE